MKKGILLGLMIHLFSYLFSQNIIQDNKGATSLGVNTGESAKPESVDFSSALLKLSTSEKKLEANYYQYFTAPHPVFIGASASGELKNSLGSLFESGDVAPGGIIRIKAGIRLDKKNTEFNTWFDQFVLDNGRRPDEIEMQGHLDAMKPVSDLWLVTNLNFTASKFKRFHPDSSFNSQIEKVNFNGTEFDIGLNYWNSNILKTTFLFGATIGSKRNNNFDDLTESTQEVVTTRTSKADTSSRKVTEKNVVYQGEYTASTVFPLKLDAYFKPHVIDNIAFLLFSRTDFSKKEKPKTKVGFGFYFLRKKNMFDPVFGVNIDYKDVFNTDTSDDLKNKTSKLSIGLVAKLGSLSFQK